MVRKHILGDFSFHQYTLNDVIKRFSKFEALLNTVVVHYVPPPSFYLSSLDTSASSMCMLHMSWC